MPRSQLPFAGYVRVSFVGARKGDRFHSPDQQESMIRAWAAREGVTVEVLPAELNAKGSDADRPVLARAVEGVERGEYAGIVAAYLSRFARSTKHTLEIYDRVEAAGGRVVAIAENTDTSTPDGRMTRTIQAAIAQADLERHSDRFALLREQTVARGIWSKRQTPLGYVRDPDTRRLRPSADADRVRALFAGRAAGESMSHLAHTVGMTSSGVRQLLRNRVYLGELRSGEHVNPDAHPPIVTVEQWEAAQSTVRRPVSNREPALLSGLVRCGSCGRVCSRSSAKRARGGEIYICHSGNPCPARASVTAQTLHEYVEPIVLAELEALAAEPGDAADAARLDEAVRAAEDELAGYLAAVSVNDVGAQAFAAGARSRREEFDRARRERQQAVRHSTMPADLPALYPTLSSGEKNAILRGLLEAVVVWPSDRKTRIPVPQRTQLLLSGAGVVSDFGTMPEKRRPAVAIDRLDDTDPRLAGTGLHDASERVSG